MKIIQVCFLFATAISFGQAETLQEIRGLIQDHSYARAEVALQTGLKEHPKSALGWYYLAQDEYYLGKPSESRAALARAQALDPQLTFTHDPQEFYRLQQRLSPNFNATTHAYTAPAPVYTHPVEQHTSGFSSLLFWLFILGFLAVVAWLIIAALRPRYVNSNFGSTAAAPPGGPYPGGAYPPAYPSSGLGGAGTFLGGMAAGALADELLRPRDQIIREEIITEQGSDRPVDNGPLPFDSGNTNDTWSSDDSSSSFDGGGSSSGDSGGW